jgi:hypothetical protein
MAALGKPNLAGCAKARWGGKVVVAGNEFRFRWLGLQTGHRKSFSVG